jgi:hypothetical protein
MCNENSQLPRQQADPQPAESMERRQFLGLTLKWSSAALATLLLLIGDTDEAEAASWINRRGGGGWVNGGGWGNRGGSWGNRGGSWANRGGGWGNRGGSWINRGGGGWVDRRGGGSWINLR